MCAGVQAPDKFCGFLKLTFMLQQLHNIASGAYVAGHGARLMTQFYAGQQRLPSSGQFKGSSACYVRRVLLVCMR